MEINEIKQRYKEVELESEEIKRNFEQLKISSDERFETNRRLEVLSFFAKMINYF